MYNIVGRVEDIEVEGIDVEDIEVENIDVEDIEVEGIDVQDIRVEDIDVDCAKEILVGQPGAGTGQLVVSAKLIMEIVWMATQPFVNLCHLLHLFRWTQCTLEPCGRRGRDSRPL